MTGGSTRSALLVALCVAFLAGCGTMGTWGADHPEGDLSVSLSDGIDEAVGGADHGQAYTLRLTLRNTLDTPVSLGGVSLVGAVGGVKLVDAMASTREQGDREGHLFTGWPLSAKQLEMGELDDVSATTVPANGAVDLAVAFTYTAGSIAGFSAVDVIYRVGGAKQTTEIHADVTLCQGDQVDGDDCAERPSTTVAA